MEPLVFALAIQAALLVAGPIGVAACWARRHGVSWRTWGLGAACFVASQALRLPLLVALTAIYELPGVPGPPPELAFAFNLGILAATSGLFEEWSRYLFLYWGRESMAGRHDLVFFGLGHGGIEAIVLGLVGVATVVWMVATRGVDPLVLGVPADQVEAALTQAELFWETPPWMAALGVVERAGAMTFHVAASLGVAFAIRCVRPRLVWVAVLAHAVLNALVVLALEELGALGSEAVFMALVVTAVVPTLRWLWLRHRALDEGPGIPARGVHSGEG